MGRATVRIVVWGLVAGCNGSLSYYGKPEEPPPNPDDVVVPEEETTPDTTEPPSSTTTTPTGSTSTDTGTPVVTTTTPTLPWVNGDPTVPPPYTELDPPELVRFEPCVAIGLATSVPDGSGEVFVESHDDNSEVKDLDSPLVGWYDLYDQSLANSGIAETNEIARIRVGNGLFPDGFSSFANCGTDWVGPDADNAAVTGTELYYLGTFWFEPGVNVLDLEHFCPSIRLGICPELEDLSDPDSTCASGDDNDLRLVADGLCLVEPTPAP